MELTAALLRKTLSYDAMTGAFTWLATPKSTGGSRKVGGHAGSRNKVIGYIYIGINRRTYLAHRLAWLYVHGCWPEFGIDHINGDRADNRISNLRDVPQRINSQNLRVAKVSNESSGLLGVSKDKRPRRAKRPYSAYITLNSQRTFIGAFSSAEEAHEAYLAAKRQHHIGNTL